MKTNNYLHILQSASLSADAYYSMRRLLTLWSLAIGIAFVSMVTVPVSAAAGCSEAAGGDQNCVQHQHRIVAQSGAAGFCKSNCTPFSENPKDPSAPKARDVKDSKGFQDLVSSYITPIIKALSALVGIAVTISVVYAGIQYASAGGDSGKVEAAKKRIMTAIFTLAAFIFFYAFLRWLLPGGLPG